MKRKRAKPKAQQVERRRPFDGLNYARLWLLAAFVALVAARPLVPSEGASWLGDDLPFDLLLLIVAAGYFLLAAARGALVRPPTAIDVCLAVLVITCVISSLGAASSGNPRLSINALWLWVGMGLIYFLARQLPHSCADARALVAVMVALAAVLSVFGFYQTLVSLPADRAAYQANPEDVMRRSLGQVYPEGSLERLRFEDRLNSREPLATFALTNSLAGVLGCWLVMALGIAWSMFEAWRGKRGSTALDAAPRTNLVGLLRAAGLAACIVAIATCLLLTKSRSAYVAVAVGTLLVPWSLGRVRWNARVAVACGGVVLLLVALAAIGGGLDIQVLSEASKSLGFRLQYWQATLAMIARHPLLGVGPGNFQDYYTQFKLPQASEEVRDPHNFVLEVWSTAGTLAAVALLAALGLLAARVWRSTPARSSGAASTTPRHLTRSAGFIFAGGLLALGVAFIAGPLFGYALTEGQLVAAAVVGALVVAAMWPWIVDGALSPRLAAVGLLVLAINLLAAGGITFPSVAGSFWLLFAMTLNLTEPEPAQNLAAARKLVPQLVALGGLVLAAVAAAACYYTAYRPVVRLQQALADAESIAHPQARAVALLDATIADPYSAEPWVAMAEAQLAAMRPESGNSMAYQHFLTAAERVRDLRPHSSASWRQIAHWYLSAYQKNHAEKAIASAIEALRTAVELYPSSAALRAELALALRSGDKHDAAVRQAQQALELDEQMPHADKKLSPETRRELESLLAVPGAPSKTPRE